MLTGVCLRWRIGRLLKAVTCSYSDALRLAGEGSQLAKCPLGRPYPLEAWCLSTRIAVPSACRRRDSRICVAPNKRRCHRTPERTAVLFFFVLLPFIMYLYFYFLLSSLVSFCLLVLLLFRFLPSFRPFSFVSFYFFLFYSLLYIKLLALEGLLELLANQ